MESSFTSLFGEFSFGKLFNLLRKVITIFSVVKGQTRYKWNIFKYLKNSIGFAFCLKDEWNLEFQHLAVPALWSNLEGKKK